MSLGFDVMWFIQGEWDNGRVFYYCGGKLTRREAIAAHTRAKGKTWVECRRDGDRAVKCHIARIS